MRCVRLLVCLPVDGAIIRGPSLQIERAYGIQKTRGHAAGVVEVDAPLVPEPPHPACECSVIIPVRDEAEHIPATLTALIDQVDIDGRRLDPVRYEVILLANNCTDESAQIARRVARANPWLPIHIAEVTLPEALSHVGVARRLLMDEACRRLASLGRQRGVIASTDGDTCVHPAWVAGILAEVEQGADAVGGRILVDHDEFAAHDSGTRRFHLLDVTWRYLVSELDARLDPNPHDPWPRHFQHFGPSLAVTVEAYRRAGGLPVRPSLEDVALFRALQRIDARIRHSPLVRVVTSARPVGRTRFGFAVQLRMWSEMGLRSEKFVVEPVAEVERRVLTRRELRFRWPIIVAGGTGAVMVLVRAAETLDIDQRRLADLARSSATFGEFWQRVEDDLEAQTGRQQQPIDEAIRDIRTRLEALRVPGGWSPAGPFQEIEPVKAGAFAGDVS